MAALRWHGRLELETPTLTLAESQFALAALCAGDRDAIGILRIPWLRFAVVLYSRELRWNLVFASVLFPTVLVYSFLGVSGGGVSIWIVRALLSVGGLWFLGAPAAADIRMGIHARSGLLASADVLACTKQPGRYGQPQVSGERTVHHPSRSDFVDRFVITAPWGDEVRPGSRLDVLVSPSETRTSTAVANLIQAAVNATIPVAVGA